MRAGHNYSTCDLDLIYLPYVNQFKKDLKCMSYLVWSMKCCGSWWYYGPGDIEDFQIYGSVNRLLVVHFRV